MAVEYCIISIGTLSHNRLWGEGAPVRTAHATTTLVSDGKRLILVDPSLPSPAIEARFFERTGKHLAEVTDVFCTSLRPVHRRSVEALPDAAWWAAEAELAAYREALGVLIDSAGRLDSDDADRARAEMKLVERFKPAPDKFSPQIDLYPLPGPSQGSAGLLLTPQTTTVIIAGDAALTGEHILRAQVWEGCGDRERALESLRDILEMADVIVPGHDNVMFSPERPDRVTMVGEAQLDTISWGQFLAGHVPELILLPVLLVVSAFFSGSETALFNLTRAQLHRFLHAGRSGQLVVMLLRRPRRVLNILLLGNLIVNVAYAGISAFLVLELNSKVGLPGVLAAAVSLAPLLVLILFGEVAPKSIAMVTAERLAPLAAPVVEGLGRLMAPLLWVLDKIFVTPLTRIVSPRPSAAANITADELAALLDLSARRGVINLQAGAMLQEIVSLTDLRARDIMVPRVDMIALEASWPAQRVAEVFKKARLRRIPVYDGDVDHILGVVHAKRLLLNPGRPLKELVAKVPFIPEAANVERVLTQFRVTRTQMAVVVDEYGGTAGLVTLEDVLEEIVGDLPDPHRSERRLVERISRQEYLIDGELGIHEWADVFQTNLGGRRISTVGGFVTSLLGRIPKAGDVVVYRNLRFTVQSMQRRRIEKLRLELLEGRP